MSAGRTPSRPGPGERVRRRLAAVVGPDLARELPTGYQRLGRVLVVRLPEALRPEAARIGAWYLEELGVATVLARRGPVGGEMRLPDLERIAGDGTETEVVEHGIRYRFDAARLLFARGNRTERQRLGALVRPGETVVDLFAGIGYFALPAAVHGRAARVLACEVNPVAFAYLVENVRCNGVEGVVEPIRGDNRTVDLPRGAADRVVLGWLPDAIPWLDRGLALLRRSGGWLHVHRVEGTRSGVAGAEAEVRQALGRLGAPVETIRGREVKAYGPGRLHAVVDVRTRGAP